MGRVRATALSRVIVMGRRVMGPTVLILILILSAPTCLALDLGLELELGLGFEEELGIATHRWT